jgi:hypothetical protein
VWPQGPVRQAASTHYSDQCPTQGETTADLCAFVLELSGACILCSAWAAPFDHRPTNCRLLAPRSTIARHTQDACLLLTPRAGLGVIPLPSRQRSLVVCLATLCVRLQPPRRPCRQAKSEAKLLHTLCPCALKPHRTTSNSVKSVSFVAPSNTRSLPSSGSLDMPPEMDRMTPASSPDVVGEDEGHRACPPHVQVWFADP